MRTKISIVLPLLALPNTLAQPTSIPKNNSTIQWENCTAEYKFAAFCGQLTVPLDYTDVGNGKKLNLSLVKLPAPVQPSKGSILINPGGPGNSALQFISTDGPLISVMTGGHHDIVAVDPRGTGKTLPINCYPNPIDRLVGNLGSAFTNSSDTALGSIWARAKQYTETCYQNAKEVGELMGTSFVARDFMQVVDALGEDGMLRYWGQSYGTYLGAVLASMFPDRIDRMVIDGVVNPHDYLSAWEYDPSSVGDLVLEKYTEACVKAGQNCSLAKPGVTAESLTKQIYDLIQEVKFNPIVMGSNASTDLVTYDSVLGALNSGLRITVSLGIPLANHLNAIMERNLTAYRTSQTMLFGPTPTEIPNGDNLSGIRCSDADFRCDNLDELKPRVDRLLQTGRLFGDTYTSSYLTCSLWKFNAKGRYEGDFKAKTKNPVMIIGSPYDLRTPLVSAKNVSAGFEGSVVLQHNGLGHCVLYSPGQCAIKATQDYFINGTLPQPGTVCEQDFGVFANKSYVDSFLPQLIAWQTAKL